MNFIELAGSMQVPCRNLFSRITLQTITVKSELECFPAKWLAPSIGWFCSWIQGADWSIMPKLKIFTLFSNWDYCKVNFCLMMNFFSPTMHEDAFGQRSEVANSVTRLTQNTFYTRKNVIAREQRLSTFSKWHISATSFLPRYLCPIGCTRHE